MAASVSSLSVRDLEYLVAVADHAHFGRAAEACGVSQPGLSSQVKKAEDVLGVALFERTRRRVMLTPVGAEVVAQARVVLGEMRKLLDAAGGRREALSGAFRLGAIATLGPYLLPHLLRPLRRAHPRLALVLREGLTRDLVADLRGGGLDALLVAAPVRDDALAFEPLFDEPFLLALPSGHPLESRRSLRGADLGGEELLLLEEGHCLREQALEVCPAARGAVSRLQATSLETLRQLVAAGAGYSLLPRLAARDDVHGLVRYRELARPAPGRTIVLAWRRAFPRAEDVRALARLIRQHLPEGVSPARA